MGRVIDNHRGAAVGSAKSARTRGPNGGDIGPRTAVKHIDLAVCSKGHVGGALQIVPGEDITGRTYKAHQRAAKLRPPTHFLRQAVAKAHVIAVDPAAFSAVLGVLFVNAWLEKEPKKWHYLNPAVFFAIFLGCATNCFPAALPLRLALVVAAYSAGVKDLIAASGK